MQRISLGCSPIATDPKQRRDRYLRIFGMDIQVAHTIGSRASMLGGQARRHDYTDWNRNGIDRGGMCCEPGGEFTVKAVEGSSISSLRERVVLHQETLSPAEKRVADFFVAKMDELVLASAADIGAATETSDATVVRTAKSLGFSGLRALKHAALAEINQQRDPARILDSRLGAMSAAKVGYSTVIADTISIVEQALVSFPHKQWEAATNILAKARSVISFGIGTAAIPADYLALQLSRIGVRAESITMTGFRLADRILSIDKYCAVIAFAPIRDTRELRAILAQANQAGARVILVSESLGMLLQKQVDILITTPSSIRSTSSESIVPLIMSHALALAVASTRPHEAVKAMSELNRLRADIVGGELSDEALKFVRSERGL